MHITKRDGIPVWKAWVIRGAAILIAILFCGLIMFIVTRMNPITAVKSMYQETFDGQRRSLNTLYRVAILLGISLAVTPAFKMRFWNIGAEGQVWIGAFAAAAVMFYFGRIPFFNDESVPLAVKNLIVFPTMMIAGVSAGALWGFLPAFFKSRWNTNETLFTLMMNYIAIQIVKFMLNYENFPPQFKWTKNTAVGYINSGLNSYKIGQFPQIPGSPATEKLIPIIVVLILAIVLYLYLRFSKQGYEISVVGESERTASYAGIKVNRVVIRTMILSGAICGLIGFLIVGAEWTIDLNSTVDGRGYTAVMVSWMSQFNPIGMFFSSLLLVFMQFGAKGIKMQDGVSLDKNFANMLMAIILFFIIGCEFFINYKLQFGHHKKKEV